MLKIILFKYRNQIVIGASIILLLLVHPFSVKGLSPMHLPDCFVRGKILNVTFHEAVDLSKPNLPGPSFPDRLVLDLLIREADLIGEWDYEYDTCEELYPIDEEIQIYIAEKDIIDDQKIKEGEVIDGKVVNYFGPFFAEFSVVFPEIDENGARSEKKVPLFYVILSGAGVILTLLISLYEIRKGKKKV